MAIEQRSDSGKDRDLRPMRLMASLTKAEFATLCEQTRTKQIDAINKVVEREARRITRASK
jgi:hypothetical protein